jgi:hypothetical protein
MKTPKQWQVEFEQTVDMEEHPKDRQTAFNKFIRAVQLDAAKDYADEAAELRATLAHARRETAEAWDRFDRVTGMF